MSEKTQYQGVQLEPIRQTDGCICRWEVGPVMREQDEEEFVVGGWATRLSRPTIWVREAKHYINEECKVHRELLRPVAQKMLEDYKAKYPGVVALAERLAAGLDRLGSETDEAVYFEFSSFRLRVPKSAVESGLVNLATTSTGGMPVAQGLAYQFYDADEAKKWCSEQSAWLVWKFYADDPKTLPGHERSWIGVWDNEDPYFLPIDGSEEGGGNEGHCARCHHVCSRFCIGMVVELTAAHVMRECTQHWMGCPGC